MLFTNKEDIVKQLVQEFNEKESSFYNTSTNKSREKFWTYNRCLDYYCSKKYESMKILDAVSWINKNREKYPNGSSSNKIMDDYAKYYHNATMEQMSKMNKENKIWK